MPIKKACEGIYRILVPFEELYTTVYAAVGEEGVALIDSATYPSDIRNYILPALRELGISDDAVKYILLSHLHGDHAGGATELCRALPNAVPRAFEPCDLPGLSMLSDSEILLGFLQAVKLPGHAHHSGGFLDLRHGTLLSADCLQLYGVGKYTNGIFLPDEYEKSIEKIKNLGLKRIVAAHDYEPLGAIAEGEAEVKKYLDTCLDALKNKK